MNCRVCGDGAEGLTAPFVCSRACLAIWYAEHKLMGFQVRFASVYRTRQGDLERHSAFRDDGRAGVFIRVGTQ